MATNETTSLSTRLIETLGKYRKPLVWGMIVIVVALIGTFAYLEIQKQRSERALEMVEDAERLFEQWGDSLDDASETAATELREELEARVDEIVRRFPRKYAANRALFLQAEIAWRAEEWERAARAYEETADAFPDSHLAPVSLYSAGAAFEEAGNTEDAAGRFQRIVDEYGEEPTPVVPQALFSLGRFAEEQSSFQEAAEFYRRLVEEHAGSSWTSLARSRIILLTAQGRVE